MSKRQAVKVSVHHHNIFGSMIEDGKYENDTLVSVIGWLQEILKDISEEHRASAKIEIESVGGCEGEHHSEVEIYYERPETDAEMQAREAKAREYLEREAQRLTAMAAQAQARLRQS